MIPAVPTALALAAGYVYLFPEREKRLGKRPKDPNFGYEVAIADSNQDGIINSEDGWDGMTTLDLINHQLVEDVQLEPQHFTEFYNWYDLETNSYGYNDPAGFQQSAAAIESGIDSMQETYDSAADAIDQVGAAASWITDQVPQQIKSAASGMNWIFILLLILVLRR